MMNLEALFNDDDDDVPDNAYDDDDIPDNTCSTNNDTSYHQIMNISTPTTSPQHKQCMESPTDRPRRLKLTILDLTGIRMKGTGTGTGTETNHNNTPIASSSSRESNTNIQKPKFAATASVSFAGSHDPKDIRVASSGFCSASGRLCVESLPVIAPFGTSDGLVAVWDDSPKGKGSFPQKCPRNLMRPHLFVNFPNADKRGLEEKANGDIGIQHAKQKGNMKSTSQLSAAESSLSASSISPDLDGTDAGSSITRSPQKDQLQRASFTRNFANITQTSLPEETELRLPPQIQRQNSELSTAREAPINLHNATTGLKLQLKNDFVNNCIVNTPSTAIETSIPEILELNLVMHVHPTNDEEDSEEICDIRSALLPGNGAVAHLVLFPDILNDKNSNDNSRIIELPVRKRTISLSRDGSNVSGLTSRCTSTIGSSSRHDVKRFFNDSNILVDIGEDSVMRIKLEECTEEDEIALEAESRSESCVTKSSPTRTCVESNHTENVGNTHSGEQNKNEGAHFKAVVQTLRMRDELKRGFSNIMNGPGGSNDADAENASNEPQIDLSSIENLQDESKKQKDIGASNDNDAPELNVAERMLCNMENVLNVFSGFVANCNEDINLYASVGHNPSMDSTINTFEG